MRRLKGKTPDKKPSEQIEKRHQSHPLVYVFSVIILVIVVVTFVALPFRPGNFAAGSLVFGKYNGEDIRFIGNPQNYFARQRDLLQQQIESQQATANPELVTYQVWRGAFERTVVHTAILQDAHRSGLIVTGHRVDEALAKYGPYTVNGKFSVEAYNQASPSDRQANRELYAEDLIQQQYYDDILYDQKVSTNAVDFIKGMASPERDFRYVVFSFAQYPANLVVKFGQAHANLFRTINMSRITVKSSESDTNAIYQKLEENPNLFEEIAKNQSKDSYADKGGEMGWVDFNSLKPDFQNVADLEKLFAMKSGQISPVIKTSFGWVIYRVNQPARQPDFTDPNTVKTVRAYMEQYERGQIEDYLSNLGNEFRDAAAKVGFDAASVRQGLAVHQTNYFPINYGNAFFLPQMKALDNNDALASGAYNQSFFQELFSLKIGAISKPIILDTNIVVVDPLDERSAPAGEATAIGRYYPYILQQYTQTDLVDHILQSPKFEDNFQQVFLKNFNFASASP